MLKLFFKLKLSQEWFSRMVYDEELANRVRNKLPDNGLITERRMFGSLAFMYQNNMVCAITEDSLMARVGPEYYEEALSLEFVNEMDFTGRTMKNIVVVSPDGIDEEKNLEFWINKCMSFASLLPPKIKPEKKRKSKSRRTVL